MDKKIKNKKGQMTVFLLFGILLMFVLLLFFIIGGTVISKINDSLSQNITLGQTNLKTVSDSTFGKFNSMFVLHGDFIGLAIIFGMILGLFLSSYFLRNKFPKFGVIFDIFLIITAFIISLYIKAVYSTLVVTLGDAGLSFAQDNLTNTSNFILNLPIFIPIIGIIMMILFHSSIPRKQEEVNMISNIAP